MGPSGTTGTGTCVDNQQRAIDNILRGLVDADSELLEADRRASRRRREGSTPASGK